MAIELKNINLDNVSLMEQVDKAQEEEQEFWEAYGEQNKEHLLEEFYDSIQAKLGLMYKLGITAEEVMEAYSKHLEKIKNRPREVEA